MAKACGELDRDVMFRGGIACKAVIIDRHFEPTLIHMDARIHDNPNWSPSTIWAQGGPIIERANITIIRADDHYDDDAQGFTTNKRIPQWWAECDRWVGHSATTSYEGEHMEPAFMIEERGGQYGTSPLIAAMRAYVAFKLGSEIDAPDAVLGR